MMREIDDAWRMMTMPFANDALMKFMKQMATTSQECAAWVMMARVNQLEEIEEDNEE
jgi:hypothetical protein